MRALFGLCAGLALAFALVGCGSGGVPDNVPRVKTGGTKVISKNTAGPITTGERLGNALPPPAVSQSGTVPIAGTGNDLTGAAGIEVVGDSDFIGVDEIDNFADFETIRDFADLDRFGAGFAVPGVGAVNTGAITTSTTTTRSTTNDAGVTGPSTTTTTTTTRSTNRQ